MMRNIRWSAVLAVLCAVLSVVAAFVVPAVSVALGLSAVTFAALAGLDDA